MKTIIALIFALIWSTAPANPLQDRIGQAIKSKTKLLKLEPGVYRLDSPLVISKANDLTIDGTGVKLLYTKPKMNCIQVGKSTKLTLKGFTIDFETLPFTQGTVTAVTDKTVDIEHHRGYPELSKEYLAKFAVHIFDPLTRDWKARGHNSMAERYQILSPTQTRILLREGTEYLTDSRNPVLKVGDLIVIAMRATTGISFSDCNDITVDGMVVNTLAGITFLGRGGDGVHTFKNLKIVPGPKPEGADQARLISTCADGINYAGFRGRLVVENCDFSFMADDGINFYGAPGHVLQVIDPCTIIATASRKAGEHLRKDDTLQFFSADTLAPVSEVKAVKSEIVTRKIDEIRKYIRQAGLDADGNPDCYIVKIVMDRATSLKTGQQISFKDFKTSGAIIRNNYFHHHRARGIRLQVNNTIIENNRFENIMHAAITIGPEGVFEQVAPFESSWVENIIVRNNKITNVGRGYKISEKFSVAPGAIATEITKFRKLGHAYAGHKNFLITGNEISGCSVSGIFMCAVDGLTITGNKLSNTNLEIPQSAFGMLPDHAINCYYSSGLKIEGNVLSNPGRYCRGLSVP